jgi:two-component system, NarL family, response regulator LiaR
MPGRSEIISEVDSAPEEIEQIKILLADDHPLLRRALKNILLKQDGFNIVGEASDGEEAVHLAAKLKPDVVIMDISMPKLNGLEATRQIKTMVPNMIVLVLTVHDDKEHIMGMLEAGAAGYLTKSIFGEEIVHAIRTVVSGEAVLSPLILQKILKDSLPCLPQPLPLNIGEKLTVRELEILKLAARGMNNKDIAKHLGLSLRTVKGYMVEIFTKLRVGSRTEAVVTSLRLGFLNLSDME